MITERSTKKDILAELRRQRYQVYLLTARLNYYKDRCTNLETINKELLMQQSGSLDTPQQAMD